MRRSSHCRLPGLSCVCVCTVALQNPNIEWIVGVLFFNNIEFARMFLKTILPYCTFEIFSTSPNPNSFSFHFLCPQTLSKYDGVIKDRNTQMHSDLNTSSSSSLCQAPFVLPKGGCYRQIMNLEAWGSGFKPTSTCTFPD